MGVLHGLAGIAQGGVTPGFQRLGSLEPPCGRDGRESAPGGASAVARVRTSGAALPCWLDGPLGPGSRLTDGRLPGGFVLFLSCLGPMPSSVLPMPFSTGFASCLVGDGKAVAANTQAKLLGQFISPQGVAPVALLPFRPLVPCPVVLQAALVLFLGCFRGYIVRCSLLGLLLSCGRLFPGDPGALGLGGP